MASNDAFREFITVGGGLAVFSSLLILPIQRIPRYEMLIRELLRKTPPRHPDYKDLNDAFAKIKAIALLIDSRKDEQIDFQEVIRVHSILEPKLGGPVVPSQRFVGEYSFRVKRSFGRAEAVCAFIFSDMLILANPIEGSAVLKK
jgi:hypothetical protein